MPLAIPYLTFKGQCAQAMQFYEKALNGKILLTVRNGELPYLCSPEDAHLICHARLSLPDGGVLYAGDAPSHMPFDGMTGVCITLDYAQVEDAQRVFEQLAQNGKITMPLAPALWAKIFGMVTDQYGTSWIINGEPQEFSPQ